MPIFATIKKTEISGMNYKCVFCQIRSFETLLNKHQVEEEKKDKIVKDFLTYLSGIDYHQTAPDVARELQATIRKVINDPDPFRNEKRKGNREMLAWYPKLQEIVENADDKFDTALRLAIAGNIIDFGPGHQFDVMETVENVLHSDFTIDHSEKLRQAVHNAKNILYLGDNAGEIVFDKLFLETINHKEVYFAVRESPVINDALKEDAYFVGMDKIANIITNGYDAPSTILDKSSPEFLEIFHKADLVISKGMGNFEGLMNCKRPNLFFLFMVKCELIANIINANVKDFVVLSSQHRITQSL